MKSGQGAGGATRRRQVVGAHTYFVMLALGPTRRIQASWDAAMAKPTGHGVDVIDASSTDEVIQ